MANSISNVVEPISWSDSQSAIVSWCKLLGSENVITESEKLFWHASSDCLAEVRPCAVLRPSNTSDVVQIVDIARKHKVPVYPISAGKNWGYGATKPSAPGCAIIDMSRMNRIISVDADLAYAVVEPGVTQKQLFDYLEQNKINLTFDVTGSTVRASLVGNLLERGSGPTRYADHFLQSAGMEVVLGDGRIVNTGFGHLPNSKVSHIHKWGLGPFIDGIFTQSNFGIVTKVGIWLLPKPEKFSIVLSQIKSDEQLATGIDALRKIKLAGVLPGSIHIANDLRVISVLQNFPFKTARDSRYLAEEEIEELRRHWKVGAWNILAFLDGTSAQIGADFSFIKRELKGIAKVQIYSEKVIEFFAKRPKLAKLLGQDEIGKKLSVLRLMKGIPSDVAIRGVYWRKKFMPGLNDNPVDDRCGCLWLSPVIPMTSHDVTQFTSTLRVICKKFFSDVNVSINLLTERTCFCTIGIFFDGANIDERERAKSLYNTLMKEMLHHGYPPYRLGSDLSSVPTELISESNAYWKTCQAIKSALDPLGIIAPGRYGIS